MSQTLLPALEDKPLAISANDGQIPGRPVSFPRRVLLAPGRWGQRAVGSVCRHPWLSCLVVALLAAIGLGAAVTGVNIWAGHHFRDAQASFARYRDGEAMDHLHACLQIWPRDPETLLLAARAARRLGAFAEAKDFLDRYENERGEDDKVILESVLIRAEEGQLDEVQDFCQLLVKRGHPSTSLILEAQARGYLRSFRLASAAACLKKWLTLSPTNPQALFLQGKVYEESLIQMGAIASYREVIRLDPEHDEARKLLIILLLDLARGDEALRHARALSKRQPSNPLVRVLLARCLAKTGRVADAATILDEVLADDPQHPDALSERGSLALQQGDSKAAEAWLRQAIAREPANAQSQYQLFLALSQNGKTEEASQAHKRLEQMKEDIKRIQEIVTTKMQARPHDPDLHYECARIALRAGNAREGLRWLQSALRENPDYLPAHQALVIYFEETGSPGRAARQREALQAASRRSSHVPAEVSLPGP